MISSGWKKKKKGRGGGTIEPDASHIGEKN
jgi:hypothetical protein